MTNRCSVLTFTSSPPRPECHCFAIGEPNSIFTIEEFDTRRDRCGIGKSRWRTSSAKLFKLCASTANCKTTPAWVWRISAISMATTSSARSSETGLEGLVHNGYSDGRSRIRLVLCGKGMIALSMLIYVHISNNSEALRVSNNCATYSTAIRAR